MIIYNKLIRDKIPQIMGEKGKKFEIEVLDNESYLEHLNIKLKEEMDEYFSATENTSQIEELADLVEVIYGILKVRDITIQKFEDIRIGKREERGGFEDKLLLKKVWD
jgi:predicted house-cleaning noncanonical NTP pyrophosphatase (MazG superfamily)